MSNTSTFWVVWSPQGHHGGYPTKRHESIDSAKTEAERLAQLNPFSDFYVLAALAHCKRRPPVDWTKLDNTDDEIPF